MAELPPIHHDAGLRRFCLVLEGIEAELTYHLLDSHVAGSATVMVIDHTGVPEAIGGRGLAGQLVKAAFEHARAAGWRVLPACSYAQAWVERHPEYRDVLVG
jgi:predicted GNAT family acetyltransferase